MKVIKLPTLPDIKLGLDGDEDDEFKDALSDEEQVIATYSPTKISKPIEEEEKTSTFINQLEA